MKECLERVPCPQNGSPQWDWEEWLAQLAGEILQPLNRVVSDPRHLWKNRFSPSKPARPNSDPMAGLPRAERSKLMQRVAEQTYADWADQAIPMRNGKTPRQASRSKTLRRQVAELLRSSQTSDRQRASREDRDPVDFGFLWDAVGLSRRDLETQPKSQLPEPPASARIVHIHGFVARRR